MYSQKCNKKLNFLQKQHPRSPFLKPPRIFRLCRCIELSCHHQVQAVELSWCIAVVGSTQMHKDVSSFQIQYFNTSSCETEKPSTLKSLECSSHEGPAEKDCFNTELLKLSADNMAFSVDETQEQSSRQPLMPIFNLLDSDIQL